MKNPIKKRELIFVLLPCLFIAGFALYLRTVEAVSSPSSQKMYISDVEFKPASSRIVYYGSSHDLRVTISHPWPYPKWWTEGSEWNAVVNPLAPNVRQPKRPNIRGASPNQFLKVASGGAITWMKNNKRQSLHIKPEKLMGYGQWKDGDVIFTHRLPLQKIPSDAGELTFHGVYFVGDSEIPVRLTKIIRKRDEKLQFNNSRYTGGKIESLKVGEFESLLWSNSPHQDQCSLTVTVSHPQKPNGKKPSVFDSDLKLIDGKGRSLKLDQKNITISYPSQTPEEELKAKNPNLTERKLNVKILKSFKTYEPLTLQGNIVTDDNWPMPFSIRLPER